MSVKSKDPDPRKGKRGYTKWDYVKVPNGGSQAGFLAGHPTGTWTHYVGCSKPCRLKMTDGCLPCPYCADGKEPEWSGYTPLYTPEFFRVFVVIKEDHLESVRELELHAQVLATRAKDRRAPVVIRPKVFRNTPLPFAEDRKDMPDMLPFLVHTLWKDEVLAKWDRMQSSAETATKSGLVPLITENLLSAMSNESARTTAAAAAAAVNEQFVRSLKDRQTIGEPATNGHHKKKPR